MNSFKTGGHDGAITAVCWNVEGSKLFSCSEDGHIIEWDVMDSSVVKFVSLGNSLTTYRFVLFESNVFGQEHHLDLKTFGFLPSPNL